MIDLVAVETIVLVMLENRSFDHILGHLSYGPYANGTRADGLREPLDAIEYENLYRGETFYPFPMRDTELSTDLPHERGHIKQQLAWNEAAQAYTMSGFAQSYFEATPTNRTSRPDPLGFLTPADLPMTRFLADNFAVCDRWFAPLPTSTQPNRIMALSGATRIDHTSGLFPPIDRLVIDWLNDHAVRWRVYHSGISFFALLGRIEIFGPNFRYVDRLAADVAHEGPDDFPQVIIIEPSYGDAPRIGGDLPNDNHPPNPVGPGEIFLRQIYEALTCNPERWSSTVLMVTYDEHGGFFDHVPPPPITYRPASNATFTEPFPSLGVRVPALIVSPLIEAKTVYSEVLDHTSILQFLAEKFTPGSAYSPAVAQRSQSGVTSVAEALNLQLPRPELPSPPRLAVTAVLDLQSLQTQPTAMQQAFAQAAFRMQRDFPRQTAQRYPEISHWVLTQGNPDTG